MSIHVHLERFEGPLGLLLHLIREQEMDIFNINIHQITRQYLEYIKTMRRLDLEVAGEFVAMAATLLHIKSKMLLPSYTEEGEEVHEDPRKELVQKLLEYKKIKELSGDLYKQPILGRDVYSRGIREDIESLEEGELVLEEKPLFSLIAAYRTALKNMKKTIHRVLGELQSISERILEIKDLLSVGRRILFGDLITDRSRESGQVLITFLSLLELAKMGFVSLFQTQPFADLHIETKRPIDRDVITQVESYDSVNAAEKAAEIFNEAQLSLDESAIESEDFAEADRPVVEETFADAATDEEIDAEEKLLFGGESDGLTEEVASVSETTDEVPEAAASIVPEAVVDEVMASEIVPADEATPATEGVVEAPVVAEAPVEAAEDNKEKTLASVRNIMDNMPDLAFLTGPEKDGDPEVNT